MDAPAFPDATSMLLDHSTCSHNQSVPVAILKIHGHIHSPLGPSLSVPVAILKIHGHIHSPLGPSLSVPVAILKIHGHIHNPLGPSLFMCIQLLPSWTGERLAFNYVSECPGQGVSTAIQMSGKLFTYATHQWCLCNNYALDGID